MKALAAVLLIQWFFGCVALVAVEKQKSEVVPVLVELFTSEGCSSCPPADNLLRQLDAQPIPGVELIVLSEHVDYWNHIGWKDPYSSKFFSDRQSAYAQRFGGGTVYTPQMIVDGTREFVGSDRREAEQAIRKSRSEKKVPVAVGTTTVDGKVLHAQVEVGALPASLRARSADIYVAVALNQAESQVLRGENEGRRLQHVAVVQSLTKVGTVDRNRNLAQNAAIKLEANSDTANLRVVVFAQDPSTGRVLGSALKQVKP
jgi:hypothetical protein